MQIVMVALKLKGSLKIQAIDFSIVKSLLKKRKQVIQTKK